MFVSNINRNEQRPRPVNYFYKLITQLMMLCFCECPWSRISLDLSSDRRNGSKVTINNWIINVNDFSYLFCKGRWFYHFFIHLLFVQHWSKTRVAAFGEKILEHLRWQILLTSFRKIFRFWLGVDDFCNFIAYAREC